MEFKELVIKNFRNIEDLELSLNPRINVFVGQNGHGKTNLLEALYLLTRGQSFRPAVTENFINYNSKNNPGLIKTNILDGEKENRIQLKLGLKDKTFLLDEKKINTAHLTKRFPSVLFSPESLSAIKEGDEQRRRLLDEMIVLHQSQNALMIASFKKCLKTKNRLLKQQLKDPWPDAQFQNFLDAINQTFLKSAVDLTEARTKAINASHKYFINSVRDIFNNEKIESCIEYYISGERANDWKRDQIHHALKNRLLQLTRAEISSGVSLVGPQKHDVKFFLQGKDARYFSSQGQQRALILSFKISQIMYHYTVYKSYPILLLDDVMSELDADKRRKLVSLLEKIESQIFITTTDFQFSEEINKQNCSLYELCDGQVNRIC